MRAFVIAAGIIANLAMGCAQVASEPGFLVLSTKDDASLTVNPGEKLHFVATTNLGTVLWSVDARDVNKAEIDGNGLANIKRAGSIQVIAKAQGITSRALIASQDRDIGARRLIPPNNSIVVTKQKALSHRHITNLTDWEEFWKSTFVPASPEEKFDIAIVNFESHAVLIVVHNLTTNQESPSITEYSRATGELEVTIPYKSNFGAPAPAGFLVDTISMFEIPKPDSELKVRYRKEDR